MTDVRGQRARGYQTTPRGNSWPPPLTFSYLRLFESWVLVTAIARIVRADVWGIVPHYEEARELVRNFTWNDPSALLGEGEGELENKRERQRGMKLIVRVQYCTRQPEGDNDG